MTYTNVLQKSQSLLKKQFFYSTCKIARYCAQWYKTPSEICKYHWTVMNSNVAEISNKLKFKKSDIIENSLLNLS